jgi:aerobic-type carbon monoxide dehydrogenase small subunit (CoxS/CutS family)
MTPPTEPDPPSDRPTLSRRRFLRSAGTAAASGVLAQRLVAGSEATAPAQADGGVETFRGTSPIELSINGEVKKLSVEPRTTLLNALRNHVDPPMTGTKLVCDRGNCGACTVLVDGEPAYACLLLAADQRGKKIRTIEGEGTPEQLSPLQAAFCKHDASMCGFCTPGFVMAITACLERDPKADLEAIRASCSGNLCRCGTYPHIFDAALEAARELEARGKK